ncbi:MAG: molybdopterin converting factor subunit 1 [Pirellulaceae bacterium]
MICSIKLFAVAQQRIGQQEIKVTIEAPTTVADLRTAVTEQFPELTDVLPHCMIAVNTEYASPADSISDSDEIAIIPPVSGG